MYTSLTKNITSNRIYVAKQIYKMRDYSVQYFRCRLGNNFNTFVVDLVSKDCYGYIWLRLYAAVRVRWRTCV